MAALPEEAHAAEVFRACLQDLVAERFSHELLTAFTFVGQF